VEMLDILPKLQYHKLKEVLADFLTRNHPSEILQMTKHIEANDTWPFLAEYLVRLPKAVNFHHKYFSFEENCYFILKLLQNVHSITSVAFPEHVQCEYDSEMEQLKESIKIVAYGRGFKLTVNSYFHQVME
jgi:phosphoenolpyruvate carboxylase